MTSLTVFDQVAMHGFLSDLPADRLRRIAVHGRPVLRHPGTRLFAEGDPAESFWLVRSGVVALDFAVPGRGDIRFEQITGGSVVGWSWLVPPHRCTLGAVVAQEMRAVEFRAAGVRALIGEDPDLGRELHTRFLAVVADRLAASRRRLATLYALSQPTDEEFRHAHPDMDRRDQHQ
ncbi:Crp/Fnr family transcriptional regulator [Actinoplanes sp. NPDC049265]|uniref:Crp/Fnr family transcriptional regulator n=1 Tax=Actinoplanes sp. NPDC049265 TaxID=3363902 RepID=UPI003711D5C7